jgi:hypothetical protein
LDETAVVEVARQGSRSSVSKKKLETRVGYLSVEDIVRLNRAVLVFFGLAGASTQARDSE